MRFGNSAFRTFCMQMYKVNRQLATEITNQLNLTDLKQMVDDLKVKNEEVHFSSDNIREVVIEELTTYLDESYGNEVWF